MRILLVGATGAMGKTVTEVIMDHDNIEIVAGIGNRNIQSDFPIYDDFSNIKENFDCIIDFSNNNITPFLLDYIEMENKKAVIGTTGISTILKDRMKQISKNSPILYSQNMSVGINTMDNVVRTLSSSLSDFDIEIIEKHHNKKVDAPSGTAEMLFNSIKEQRQYSYEINDRTREQRQRDSNQIGVLSLRGGTIVGEHSVIFAGIDEVIEIKHIAGSKKIFAHGAIKAALFLMDKENGFYDMKDVLNG